MKAPGPDAPAPAGRSALVTAGAGSQARLVEERRLGGPLRKVLFATDRSAASRAALLAVAGLAAGAGSEVIVLHVDDRGRPDQARSFVTDIAWGMVALAVDARPEVRQAAPGRVAAAIA